MTAEKATTPRKPRGKSLLLVLAIQIIAYVVLVALALVPGMMYGDAAKPAAVPFTIIASLAMVVLLVVFSPFRDGVARPCDRRDRRPAVGDLRHDRDAGQ